MALKTPLPGHTSDDDRRRFMREAQTLARLSHPHIAPVFEVFETAPPSRVAMELIPGRTLRSILWERAPSLRSK